METRAPGSVEDAPPAAGDEPRVEPSDAATSRVEPHGIFILAVLTAVWAWWGWKQGAYFSTVMLPGTVLLCGGAIVLALTAPLRASLRFWAPAWVALAALLALATWTLLSAFWSPAPDIAVNDAQRVFTY